ncbi:MAG: hypothetical protein WBV94_31865 [Blastocatellia bacterium]
MQDNAIQNGGENPESGLTVKQEAAILALLSQRTTRAAAKSAGVNEATLWRWLQEPEFQAAYTKARRETVKQAIARLQQNASRAVDTLKEVMTDKKAVSFARVSAAKAILDYSLKAVELEDLAERIEALESKMEGRR